MLCYTGRTKIVGLAAYSQYQFVIRQCAFRYEQAPVWGVECGDGYLFSGAIETIQLARLIGKAAIPGLCCCLLYTSDAADE